MKPEVNVTDMHLPMPSAKTQHYHVLKETFGYDSFRAGQEEVVECLLNDTSVLAVMPTGAGKSLCFQVPALVKDGLTLVVSPLVALMQDQVSALKLAGVAADAIHSNQDREANVEVWQRVANGDIKILYLAPERLMTERMLNALSRLPVSMIAIDEAHCLSQWGPAFRPDYAELGNLTNFFPNVPIAAMTATADEATRHDIEIQLFNGNHETFVSGFDRPNLTLNVSMKKGWKDQLIDYVQSRKGVSGIVYCLSRKKTEEVAEILRGEGINAIAYHAGLSAEERTERQNRFVTEPDLVVAATVAFGMGIDKPDVRYVFHTDMPSSIEAYYQEIGRAGRDGKEADVHMLFGAGDIRLRKQFIEQETNSDEDHKRREVSRLNSLITYAEASTCRRQSLLQYFGEETEVCGNCDNCLNPVEMKDGTERAHMIFDAIFETGERYGQAHIIDVITGKETEKLLKAGHDDISSFAQGADIPRAEWQSLVRQMISQGLLEVDIAGYSGLLITRQGQEFQRSNANFSYRDDALATQTQKANRKKAKSSTTPSIDLSERDSDLLLALKKKRLALAKERGVPAYVIFTDKTLEDMAQRRPATLEAFERVRGVGKSKLKKFAEEFMAVIAG
jgi:ATP-dependent DNA helicase RecQ